VRIHAAPFILKACGKMTRTDVQAPKDPGIQNHEAVVLPLVKTHCMIPHPFDPRDTFKVPALVLMVADPVPKFAMIK
jgi:hypothetical protein